MKNRREFFRLPFTATAKIVHAHGISFYACARNISRNGIGLYSCSTLGEDTEVRVEIMFKDIRGKSIIEMVYGKIEWSYKWNWIYVLGIKFNQTLNHEETPGLMEYIERYEGLLYEDHYRSS